MQVKNPQTRATKVNSEHHKVSERSSANAQRMRATNRSAVPSATMRTKFSGSQVVNLSPIEYSRLAQKACFDKRNCHLIIMELHVQCGPAHRACQLSPPKDTPGRATDRSAGPTCAMRLGASIPAQPAKGHSRKGDRPKRGPQEQRPGDLEDARNLRPACGRARWRRTRDEPVQIETEGSGPGFRGREQTKKKGLGGWYVYS
jgi:hypothetical protein